MEYLFEQKINITALMSAFETDYKSDFYFKRETGLPPGKYIKRG